MSKCIPFPAYHDFAPIDISYLFADEKPAGKHGFLTVQGDRFVFEDGKKVRFWGTNLNSGACFPEKPYAEKLAKRLAAYGCNLVRFHQMDSEWATPSIYQLTKGQRLRNTSTYDPECFDRLDYLVSCLKKEGIYVYLDMLTYRKFKEEDGVRNSVALINRAAPYCYFDRRLIELQKEYCKTMWEHYNPYTGLQYKDDPVFVLTDAANEVDLFGAFGHKINVEPYASEFREMYRAWCRETGHDEVDVDNADLNDFKNDTLNEFKTKVCEDYHDEIFGYMRSLGVRVPMTGLNYSWRYAQCKATQHIGDFNDSHLNVRFMKWNPGAKYSRDISLHEQPEWGAMRNARMRRFDKPFFTSEWDVTFPNMFRAESPIMLAAIGMLQNWSGYTIHTYAYTSLLQHMNILGKEVNSETIGNVGYREGIFSTWNDPAKFGMFYHAAIITRREDVKPANRKITVRVDDLYADFNQNPGTLTQPSKKAFIASTEMSQIGVDYYREFEDTVPDTEPLVDLEAGEVRSDTGELYRSWKKRYGTIDTPKTKSVYGRLSENGTVAVDGLQVTCRNEYAVLALSSLDNDMDLCETDSMLLTAVGRVENTDMKMSVAPEKVQPNDGLPPYMQMDDFGKPPILCEVIEADVEIKTSRSNMVVWAVNSEGVFVGNVPTKYEDGTLKFTLGPKYPSIYYLIQAE
ncbi:MAG: hypothetical protein J6L24_01860 [Oscillospiraceae bacterium]|nr:hypothetical protein [Oscillospiraceae bacterium]